jgi:NhaP-type Na+/H+ or K+/H+ antiporter
LSDEGAIELSMTEIFLFAAAISATNTEIAAPFIKDEIDPKLSSIIFGEGIINDAVCIVLYRILKRFTNSDKGIS